MKNKPKRISVLKYIKLKLRRSKQNWALYFDNLTYRFGKRFGFWYCSHCDKMHGGRVIEYKICGGDVDSICSLGKEVYLRYNPELDDNDQWKEHEFSAYIRGIPVSILNKY